MDYGKLLHIASEVNKNNLKELEMSRKRAAKREREKAALSEDCSAKKRCKTEPSSCKLKKKKKEKTDKDKNVKDERKSIAKPAETQKYSANK